MRKAWHRLRGLWTSSSRFRVNRMLLMMTVLGSSTSGPESYVLYDSEVQRLDRQFTKDLRVMGGERTLWWEGDQVRRWSSRRIWQYRKLAPLGIEMLARRLRTLQTAVARPGQHQQWIAAVLGVLHAERERGIDSMLDADGRAVEEAHPWLVHADRDLMRLCGFSENESFAEELMGDWRRLFTDREIGEERFAEELMGGWRRLFTDREIGEEFPQMDVGGCFVQLIGAVHLPRRTWFISFLRRVRTRRRRAGWRAIGSATSSMRALCAGCSFRAPGPCTPIRGGHGKESMAFGARPTSRRSPTSVRIVQQTSPVGRPPPSTL